MEYTVTGILAILVILLFWLYAKNIRASNWPQGPPTLPFIGNLNLITVDMVTEFRKLRKQYGDVFSLVIGVHIVVVINGLETLKDLFIKHGDITSSRGKNLMISDVCKYIGIAGSSDNLWKEHNNFAISTFREIGFGKRKMEIKIIEEAEKLMDHIKNTNGQSIDIAPMLRACIANILCSVTFGKTFDYGDELINELTSCVADTQSTEEIVGILTYLPFLKNIPGDPFRYKKVMQNEARIYSFLQTMIDEHKLSPHHGDVDNYLDAYITQQKKEKESTFTDVQLLRCLTDLFVAGTDTSGIALRWFLLVLLHKPEIQESMYAEIQNEVSESKFPSMADRNKLPYCDSVLHEVLRFGNIVPLSVPHGLTKDFEFKGYLIPQHAMLIPNLDSVMNDPDLFENPFEFIPTRFLSKDGTLTGVEKIPAFGIGRRICIGESLARMELFIFATALVQRFKFLPPEECCLPCLLESQMGEARSPLPFKLRALRRQ